MPDGSLSRWCKSVIEGRLPGRAGGGANAHANVDGAADTNACAGDVQGTSRPKTCHEAAMRIMETLRPVLLPVPNGARLPRGSRLEVLRRVSRQALDLTASLVGLVARSWHKNADGAPVPSGGMYWSISHKPCWTAAVVADRPVGIDVEQIRPRNPRLFEALASRQEWVLAGAKDWLMFFRIWTAKEAVLKACGQGIGWMRDCELLHVVDGSRMVMSFAGRTWHVVQHMWDDHVASVTADWNIEWHISQAIGAEPAKVAVCQA